MTRGLFLILANELSSSGAIYQVKLSGGGVPFTDSFQENGSNYFIPEPKWYGNRSSEGRLPLFLSRNLLPI